MINQRPKRMSIRLRLTLQYGLALFAAGMVQLTVVYLLMDSRALTPPVPDAFRGPARDRLEDVLERFTLLEDARAELLAELLTLSAIAVLVVGAIALLFGWWLAGRALAPIHRIAATAEQISAGTLDQRIQLSGPNDELRELADTFDAMLDRLQASFDSQRRFVANASHELRTPMAIERSLLEVELANPDASEDLMRVGEEILAVQDRNERLIDGLLTLARGEEQVDPQIVDLADVTQSALAMLAPAIAAAGLEVRSDMQSVEVAGDPALLDRLVLNVITNAIDYNDPEGWIAVRVDVAPGDNPAGRLTVENPGLAVPDASVAGLFEPFRRGQDRTGPGVGLGLSIARAVATAHGGSLQAQARPDGGMMLCATIPAAGQH
ncbi:MAG: HAMP domain-containing protein [Actinomycetia bacterium]|nr:HAMP domain-containing protein [Actinomycetes bacterium]